MVIKYKNPLKILHLKKKDKSNLFTPHHFTNRSKTRELELLVSDTRLELKNLSEIMEKERSSHLHNVDRYKSLISKERSQFKLSEKTGCDENTILAQTVRRFQDETEKVIYLFEWSN